MAGRKAINTIAFIKVTGQREADREVQFVALIQEATR